MKPFLCTCAAHGMSNIRTRLYFSDITSTKKRNIGRNHFGRLFHVLKYIIYTFPHCFCWLLLTVKVGSNIFIAVSGFTCKNIQRTQEMLEWRQTKFQICFICFYCREHLLCFLSLLFWAIYLIASWVWTGFSHRWYGNSGCF